MNIFKMIRKSWLQHRVYKYTLKYKEALSESTYYLKLSESYSIAASKAGKELGFYHYKTLQCSRSSTEYARKSDYYKNLSDIYLAKKLDLEEELQYYNYRKA